VVRNKVFIAVVLLIGFKEAAIPPSLSTDLALFQH
jgi:hypothetical protein